MAPGANGAAPTRVLLASRSPPAPARAAARRGRGARDGDPAGVVATVAAGHRLEVALATTDQGFASPPDPAVYRIDLDRTVPAVLSVPGVPGTETDGTSVPLGPVVAVGLLLAGVVVAVVVGRVVAARRRRRDLEPGGDLAVAPTSSTSRSSSPTSPRPTATASSPCGTWASGWSAARSWGCLVPTGRGRRPRCGCSWVWSGRPQASCGCSGCGWYRARRSWAGWGPSSRARGSCRTCPGGPTSSCTGPRPGVRWPSPTWTRRWRSPGWARGSTGP